MALGNRLMEVMPWVRPQPPKLGGTKLFAVVANSLVVTFLPPSGHLLEMEGEARERVRRRASRHAEIEEARVRARKQAERLERSGQSFSACLASVRPPR